MRPVPPLACLLVLLDVLECFFTVNKMKLNESERDKTILLSLLNDIIILASKNGVHHLSSEPVVEGC